MPHVFAETNWVVDCCAPAHNRVPAATDLLRRARNGDIQLHLPSICIAESRRPLSQKFQTRLEADRIRRYVTWALGERRIAAEAAETVRVVLNNQKSLENQKEEFLRWLKRHDVHGRIGSMYHDLLFGGFAGYQNDAVKHQEDRYTPAEIEFVLYATGTFLRLIQRLVENEAAKVTVS